VEEVNRKPGESATPWRREDSAEFEARLADIQALQSCKLAVAGLSRESLGKFAAWFHEHYGCDGRPPAS
jgi:hypothetical protein